MRSEPSLSSSIGCEGKEAEEGGGGVGAKLQRLLNINIRDFLPGIPEGSKGVRRILCVLSPLTPPVDF